MKCKNCTHGDVNFSRSKNLCTSCLDKKKEYYRTHEEITKKSRQKRKDTAKLCPSFGICSRCLTRPVKEFRKWCSVCLDKKRIQDKNRYSRFTEKDKIKKNQNQRERRQKKLEQYREAGRRYYKLHPEKYSGATLKRYANKKKAGGKHTNKEWISVLERYENKCLCCGHSGKLHRDHVIPITKGGSDYISNIQPLCEHCNKKKMTKILDFRPFGRAILDWT